MATVQEIQEAFQSQTEGGAAMRRMWSPQDLLYRPEAKEAMEQFIASNPEAFQQAYAPPAVGAYYTEGGVQYTAGGTVLAEAGVRPKYSRTGSEIIYDEQGNITGYRGTAEQLTAPAEAGMPVQQGFSSIYGPSTEFSFVTEQRKKTLLDIGQPLMMQQPSPELRPETILSYSLFHPTETAMALTTYALFPQERRRQRKEEIERITSWSVHMRKEGIAGIGKQAIFTGVEYALWTGAPILPAMILTKAPTLAKVGFTALTTTFAIEMFRGGESYLAGGGLPAARRTTAAAFGFGMSAAAMKSVFEPPKIEVVEREVLGRYRTGEQVEAAELKDVFKRGAIEKIHEPTIKTTRGLTSEGEFLDRAGWEYIISDTPTGLQTIDDEFFDVIRISAAGKYEIRDVDIYAGGKAEFPIAPPKPSKMKGEGFDVFKPSKGPKTDLSKHFPKQLDVKLDTKLDIRPIKISTTTVTPTASIKATPFVSLGAIQTTSTTTRERQDISFMGKQIQLQHPKQFEYTISPVKTKTRVKRESISLLSPMKMPMISPLTLTAPSMAQDIKIAPSQMVSPALMPPISPRTRAAKAPARGGGLFPSFSFDFPRYKGKKSKIKRLTRKTIPEPSLGGIVLGRKGKLKRMFTGIEPIRPIGNKKKRKKIRWL